MRAVVLAACMVVLIVVMASVVGAEPAEQTPAPAEQAVPTAQAAPQPAPEAVEVAQASPKAAPTGASTGERVEALEKQNLVLSEDLGKTQLKARQLEDVAKQQAEAIAKLNQQVADQQAQMQAEKEKQAKRNKHMWIAVGVLFLGIIASN